MSSESVEHPHPSNKVNHFRYIPVHVYYFVLTELILYAFQVFYAQKLKQQFDLVEKDVSIITAICSLKNAI